MTRGIFMDAMPLLHRNNENEEAEVVVIGEGLEVPQEEEEEEEGHQIIIITTTTIRMVDAAAPDPSPAEVTHAHRRRVVTPDLDPDLVRLDHVAIPAPDHRVAGAIRGHPPEAIRGHPRVMDRVARGNVARATAVLDPGQHVHQLPK